MKFLIFIFLLVVPSISLSFDGLVNGEVITKDNRYGLKKASLPYAIARQGQRSADGNEAVGVYSLSSNQNILLTNSTDRSLVGYWPLTPSNYPCDEPTHCIESWDTVRWSLDETIEQKVIDRYESYASSIQPYYDPQKPSFGCMGGGMRYGDIENNGTSELVLFIDDNLMVFSPQLNKVIFMAMLKVDDWMSKENTLRHLAYHREKQERGQVLSFA